MKLARVFRDRPPGLAFELSEAGIASAATAAPEVRFHPLKPGTISVSPLRDNIVMPDELVFALRAIAPQNGKRREGAVILPDNCARVAVLDFDEFPSDPKDQLPLVRFRLKKSVPYDVDSAAVSFWTQPSGGKRVDVVAAVAPVEIIARYEAPFRAAGISPGYVTTSAIAMLRLIDGGGLAVVAKLSGRVLTLLVTDRGVLKLIRCLELANSTLADVAQDLYPTFAYVEDQLGHRAERLLVCGFGDQTDDARRLFAAELGIEVEAVASRFGAPGEFNAGLIGYLQEVLESA